MYTSLYYIIVIIKMEVPFVNLKQQYQTIKTEIDEAIKKTLENAAFILGEDVRLFEEEFAKYLSADYAIGVNSGTDALYLSLLAADIKTGDEVITAANTFIATAEAISLTGAKPVLIDIDLENYNLDLKIIEKAITKKTKAIIPVHLYGQPVNMEKLMEIAKKYNLLVVEDACQAHGSKFKGKKIGSFGDLAAFSFYPAKNLGAYGDGGAIVTSNKNLADKIRVLRDHGQIKKYYHSLKGFNSRLDNLQAAILRVKLKYLDQWNEKRNKCAETYSRLLKETSSVTLPKIGESNYHVFHLYVVRSQKRDDLQKFLKENGIGTAIHYPIPIHLTEAYQDLGCPKGHFPNTEKAAQEILSLPMFPELKEEEIEYVAEKIKEFV